MAKSIGENINTTDTASNPDPISVDSTTSTKLLDAVTSAEALTIRAMITNWGNKTLWVKRQAATEDNDVNGEAWFAGETKEVIQDGDYSGEVSGIMESGGAKDVYVEFH